MKTIKSLVLSSAAGLLAVGAAQAADLPVKAKAVEYVKVCSLYGPGFYYIPGTDTCIKIGGNVRVDVTFNGTLYEAPAAYPGNVSFHNRTSDLFADRARMQLTVDTRTATEYGVVRTFGLFDMDFSEQGGASNGTGSGPENLFIQFAGFTFGKSASAYASPWHSYPGNSVINVFGGGDSVVGINNIQYTAQFGGGVSATIGLDSPSASFNRLAIANFSTPAANVAVGGLTNAYGAQTAPDLVGNIRIDQAWGLFQLSGALHDNHASYYSTPSPSTEINGHPNDKLGGAVMAALQIKNIPTGPGDDIKMDASYAVGASHYLTGISNSPTYFQFAGTGVAGAYQSLGFGTWQDASFITGQQMDLPTAYGFRGAFNHNWDPHWSTSIYGSWAAIRYNANAKANFCASYAAGTGTAAAQGVTYTCDPNNNVSELGLVTRWTPVNNLTFFAEATWWNLHQNFTGTAVLPAATLGGNVKPTATYAFKDQSGVVVDFKVQRNF